MKQGKPYRTLALMALLSFVAMYILMYAMVDRVENALPNLNQAYMAALMAAPMVVIELVLMRHMYMNGRANLVAYALCAVIGVGAFFAIRSQTAIGDAEFLRSMVPHHAGAILMCEQAQATDPEIHDLCQRIIAGQQQEIAQMKDMLAAR
ncbi:MAG: DUF305 domain-containing protein [Hyphomonadaceae bacterium]|nr:DUF305 domain-containing protein [Hyphomonadaceae bacterium]